MTKITLLRESLRAHAECAATPAPIPAPTANNISTVDTKRLNQFWLGGNFPELVATEARRFPPLETLTDASGGSVSVERIPVPINGVDGLAEAYWSRPEAFLDPSVRAAQSAWAFVGQDAIERGPERLRADLSSGERERNNGHLLRQAVFEGSLVSMSPRIVRTLRRLDQPQPVPQVLPPLRG